MLRVYGRQPCLPLAGVRKADRGGGLEGKSVAQGGTSLAGSA